MPWCGEAYAAQCWSVEPRYHAFFDVPPWGAAQTYIEAHNDEGAWRHFHPEPTHHDLACSTCFLTCWCCLRHGFCGDLSESLGPSRRSRIYRALRALHTLQVRECFRACAPSVLIGLVLWQATWVNSLVLKAGTSIPISRRSTGQ